MRAGLILMMDRTFTAQQNAVIVEKAIRYAPRGVVGVDIAGPRPGGGRYDYRALRRWSRRRARRASASRSTSARRAASTARDEIGEVVEALAPSGSATAFSRPATRS